MSESDPQIRQHGESIRRMRAYFSELSAPSSAVPLETMIEALTPEQHEAACAIAGYAAVWNVDIDTAIQRIFAGRIGASEPSVTQMIEETACTLRPFRVAGSFDNVIEWVAECGELEGFGESPREAVSALYAAWRERE